VPEAGAVEVPADLDPAEVLSLLFPYMTAYQVLHRTAMAKSGEAVLVHGAAGRVGVAALELGALAGLRLYGTCAAGDRAAVERLGAVAIDYQNEDFLARVREMTGDGVDVVLDSLGGPLSLRSFRALRPGGRLVVFGRYATLSHGRKNWPAVIEWYAAIAALWLWDKLSPRRRVLAYRIQRFRDAAQKRPGAVGGEPRYPEWFQEDFLVLLKLFRTDKIHPVVAERLPLSEARSAHEMLESSAARESSCSYLETPGGRRAQVWRARPWCRPPSCATAIASVSQNRSRGVGDARGRVGGGSACMSLCASRTCGPWLAGCSRWGGRHR
jgi:NADPH2:quinone reductase